MSGAAAREVVGDDDLAGAVRFARRWTLVGPRLVRIASFLAEDDTDLARDLVQEARIALWEADPDWDGDDEGAWLRSCARYRMRRHLRAWDRPGRYWPTVAALEQHDTAAPAPPDTSERAA